MRKICMLAALCCACFQVHATINYWVGGFSTPDWSNPANWANGVPNINDTVFFDNVDVTVNVDATPNIAGLQLVNNSAVVLSSSNTTLLTIGNLNVSGKLVFNIQTGCTLTLQGTAAGKGVSIQTYGNFTTSLAQLDGTLVFGSYSSTWNVNSFPSSFCTTQINGTVRVLATNTGSVISGGVSNGGPGTVYFNGGAMLDWERSGGSAPNAYFTNGSLIHVTGIVGSNMNFNSSARYEGLLIWNCAAQTASGSSALLLPSPNSKMDSVRIVNTGSGSLRMATNPNGYTINHLEVNGGTVELSAANSSTNNLTDTITNELKITGGTVYGNATFNFDNLGSAYPTTTILKGNFTQSGGTLDFSNRTAGNSPGGAYSLIVRGDVNQIAGRIKATQGFGDQHLLSLSGSSVQQLSLTNFTDTISLAIRNTAGVQLQNALVVPYKLLLQSGYLQLNQSHVTVTAGRLIQSAVTPLPKMVTNKEGVIQLKSFAGTQLVPVAPLATAYNAVTLQNSAAAADLDVSVAYGIKRPGVDPLKTVTRSWVIHARTNLPEGSVSMQLQFSDSERVSGSSFSVALPIQAARYFTQWNYDPATTLNVAGGPFSYTAGPFTPAATDSFIVIGNSGFLPSNHRIYTFTGSGNWDDATNWSNNTIPPNPLPAGEEIIIDPANGDCILNVQQTIAAGAIITVKSSKNLLLPANLVIQ